MSFAIIETGGKQYKVSTSKILEVEKLEVEEGKTIKFKNGLLLISLKKDELDTRVKHIFLNNKGKKIFYEIFETQKKRIYKALLDSKSEEVINFDNVLSRIINE